MCGEPYRGAAYDIDQAYRGVTYDIDQAYRGVTYDIDQAWLHEQSSVEVFMNMDLHQLAPHHQVVCLSNASFDPLQELSLTVRKHLHRVCRKVVVIVQHMILGRLIGALNT
jgi:hypothetical protein